MESDGMDSETMPVKWVCQGYRGMDTYKGEVVVEAEDEDAAVRKAFGMVPFADTFEVRRWS